METLTINEINDILDSIYENNMKALETPDITDDQIFQLNCGTLEEMLIKNLLNTAAEKKGKEHEKK